MMDIENTEPITGAPIFDFGRAIDRANTRAAETGIRHRVQACPCTPGHLHFAVSRIDRIPEAAL